MTRPGACAQHRPRSPLLAQRGAERRGAPVLPDDGVVDRLAGARGPTARVVSRWLVMPMAAMSLAVQPGLGQRLARHRELRGPDLLGVVLDPARLREDLRGTRAAPSRRCCRRRRRRWRASWRCPGRGRADVLCGPCGLLRRVDSRGPMAAGTPIVAASGGDGPLPQSARAGIGTFLAWDAGGAGEHAQRRIGHPPISPRAPD